MINPLLKEERQWVANTVSADTVGGRLRIGRVIANSGRDILAMVENTEEARSALRLGDVLIITGQEVLAVGVVSGMNVPAPGLEGHDQDLWLAQVELTGTLASSAEKLFFQRNIPLAPALGDGVYKASLSDLKLLFRNGDENAYPVGKIVGTDDVAATIDPVELLKGGFAILGTSGVGKSSTLASLVRAFLRHRHPVTSLLIDPYNEYGSSFGKAAIKISPSAGLFPHWLLSFEEMVWVLARNGGDLDKNERSILEEAIPAARLRFASRATHPHADQSANVDMVSVDTPIPYRMMDLIGHLDKSVHTDENRPSVAYQRLKTRMMAVIADPRLAVIFGNATAKDTLGLLLTKLFRLEKNDPPMAVLQLGALTDGVDKLIVSIVCRLASALAEWGGSYRKTLILIEDAARFAPTSPSDKAAVLSLSALRRLGERPRKLGTSLGFVTSHTRGMHSDVLRRSGTFFIHRIPGQVDVDAVEEMLPEAAIAYMGSVGSLGQGEAIGIGRGVPLSGRIALAPLPQSAIPTNNTLKDQEKNLTPENINDMVGRWRSAGTQEGAT